MTANWRGIARALSEYRPVIVIDQRNHGRSGHASTQSYSDMVDDLREFLDRHNLQQVILAGHSMGGKVAMLFSLLYPARVAQLIIMDISPVKYAHHPAPFLADLIQLDIAGMGSRAEVERALQPIIDDTATRLFILQSLGGSSGAYFWRTNMHVLHDCMDGLADFPDKLVDGLTFQQRVTLFSGGQSDYVLAEHIDIMREYFPKFEHHVIAGAGHWIHVQEKKQLLEKLIKLLN